MDHLVGFGERFFSEGDGEYGEADSSGCRSFTVIQCMCVAQDFEDRVRAILILSSTQMYMCAMIILLLDILVSFESAVCCNYVRAIDSFNYHLFSLLCYHAKH
jgi:hypothetical protein